MKVRALKTFEGIKDLERDVYPKAGDVWEVSEKRANFLKSHGVVEFVEEDEIKDGALKHPYKTIMPEPIEEVELNEFGNPVGTRELKSKKKKHSKK